MHTRIYTPWHLYNSRPFQGQFNLKIQPITRQILGNFPRDGIYHGIRYIMGSHGIHFPQVSNKFHQCGSLQPLLPYSVCQTHVCTLSSMLSECLSYLVNKFVINSTQPRSEKPDFPIVMKIALAILIQRLPDSFTKRR